MNRNETNDPPKNLGEGMKRLKVFIDELNDNLSYFHLSMKVSRLERDLKFWKFMFYGVFIGSIVGSIIDIFLLH